jgi:hemerythrin
MDVFPVERVMEWKDEYSLGILEIDNQHKLLLGSFADIAEAIQAGQGWSRTHFAIVHLIQLAHLHFSFEEAMMRMFGYRGTGAHEEEHRFFFAKLEDIEKRSLRKAVGAEIIQFLQDWLTAHIMGSDREYAKHIFSGAQVVRTGGDVVYAVP